MTKFKVGDKVRVLENANDYKDSIGTVLSVNSGNIYPALVELHDGSQEPFKFNDLCLVQDTEEKPKDEAVAHPSHYGGGDNPYEVIKVAEAWGFDQDAYLFNVLKYIARAGKKGATLEDHKKARFYLDRKIARLESAECS